MTQVTEFLEVDENGVESIGGFEIFQDASELPLMDDDEFNGLCDSIRQFGLRHAILQDTFGRVVDGRNRLRACLAVGVEPRFETVDDDLTLREQVEIENLHNRSLTQSQKAVLGVKWFSDMTPSEIAARVGVSESAVEKARRLVNEEPQVAELVESGDIGVTTAEAFTKIDDAKKTEILSKFGTGDDTVGTKAKSQQTAAKVREAVAEKKEEPQPFIWERWLNKMEGSLSRLLADAPPDLQDRCKVQIGQTLSVRVRHVVDDSAADDEEAPSFVGNDVETMMVWIDGKLEAMKEKRRKEAETALAERFQTSFSKAKEVVADARRLVDGLPEDEQQKVTALLVKEFGIESAPDATKPTAYLPSLPEEHVAACEVVKKEVSQRVKELKGFAGWENGKAEAVRWLSKYIEGAGKKIRQNAGVDGVVESAPIFDTTWPEHLDTDAVKQAWNLYVSARKAAKKNIDSDVLQLRIGELSQFEHDSVVEMLTEARAGAKGPWTGFNHSGLKERFGVTRDKTGKVVSKAKKSSGDEWSILLSTLRKYSAEHQKSEIRKQLESMPEVFKAACEVGLVRIEQADNFTRKDLREQFEVKLAELRQNA